MLIHLKLIWPLGEKKKKTSALPAPVNVLGLLPVWSCDAINETKSLTRLAMGGLDEI